MLFEDKQLQQTIFNKHRDELRSLDEKINEIRVHSAIAVMRSSCCAGFWTAIISAAALCTVTPRQALQLYTVLLLLQTRRLSAAAAAAAAAEPLLNSMSHSMCEMCRMSEVE